MSTTTLLLATRDDHLIDPVLRLAAAAGIEVELCPDAGSALARWNLPSGVFVGADFVADLARLGPGRRSHVVVLVDGIADEDLFRAAFGVAAAHVVELPMAEEWLADVLAEMADDREVGGRVWGFLGGSGGVGSTTLATAVASLVSRDRSTAILDFDPWGPGLDRVLGSEGDTGVRWTDLQAAPGRLSARSLRDALPRDDALGVLTFGSGRARLDPLVGHEAVSAARRGHDVIVVDLPRCPDDASEGVLIGCDRLVLVARASVAGVAAARRVLDRCDRLDRVQLVVRANDRSSDADDVAAALGLVGPIVLGHDRGLGEQVDLGLGPVYRRRSPVTRAARELVARLSERAR
jgi:secretion/DNA translocation related CpaE-like protein